MLGISLLVELKKSNKWLHPDLQALKEKDIEIKTKDKKIKVLENLCVKKHTRKVYPGKNVIYMLTTEEHKK